MMRWRPGPARTFATTAGLVAAAGLAAGAALQHQATVTTRLIQAAALLVAGAGTELRDQAVIDAIIDAAVHDGNGVYAPDGSFAASKSLNPPPLPGFSAAGAGAASAPDPARLALAMLGDSTAVGFGAANADELPGAMLARAVAAAVDRPISLTTHGLVGAGSADLGRQVDAARHRGPTVAVIVMGANDIRDKIPPRQSAARLGAAVRRLVDDGIPVVVGSCPDFGVIEPIPQPLRSVLSSWSHVLAALQERATVSAGGQAVSIHRLVSPEFRRDPTLFAADRFHPSGSGYARAVAALAPPVIAAVQAAIRAVPAVTGT